MRAVLLVSVVSALICAPAMARAETGEAAHMADVLNDPARQEQMAAMAHAAADVLLDMPVGPLMRAAATMAGKDPEDVDPETTVGDLVGPDGEEAPREFAERLPQMMDAMATMASALEEMLPRLAEVGEKMRRIPHENQ